jgi:hypothetical protein
MSFSFPARREWAEMIRDCVLLWVPRVGQTLLPHLMAILIVFFLAERFASYFSVLWSWSMASFVLLVPLSNTLFAWASKYVGIREGASPPELEAFFKLSGWLAAAVGVFLGAASPWLLEFYGPEFSRLKGLFLILLAANILEYPRFFGLAVFGSGNRQMLSTGIEGLRIAAMVAASAALLALGKGLFAVGAAILGIQFAASLVRLHYFRKIHAFAFGRMYLVVALISLGGLGVHLWPASDWARAMAVAPVVLFLSATAFYRIFQYAGAKRAPAC